MGLAGWELAGVFRVGGREVVEQQTAPVRD